MSNPSEQTIQSVWNVLISISGVQMSFKLHNFNYVITNYICINKYRLHVSLKINPTALSLVVLEHNGF